MKPAGVQTLRSRSFVIVVHCGLWLLVYLALTGLGGKAPAFLQTQSRSASPQSLLPAARLQRLFAADAWPKTPVQTNSLDPFFTQYFNPIKAPAAPPTTRDIEVTYLGYYQTGDGPRRAMFKLGDAILVAQVGSNATANLFVADAAMRTLTLTNPAAQTNLLPLNAKTQLKVPIQ
jgi:hypothetical protein